MTTNVIARPASRPTTPGGLFTPRVTVFLCSSAIGSDLPFGGTGCDVQLVRMACSSMTRKVFLLRAFEAGADAVIVLTCPEGLCNHLDGNLRAAKRVARVKKLLDEIGLDGRRLNIFHIPLQDRSAAAQAISQTLSALQAIGPNPAA